MCVCVCTWPCVCVPVCSCILVSVCPSLALFISEGVPWSSHLSSASLGPPPPACTAPPAVELQPPPLPQLRTRLLRLVWRLRRSRSSCHCAAATAPSGPRAESGRRSEPCSAVGQGSQGLWGPSFHGGYRGKTEPLRAGVEGTQGGCGSQAGLGRGRGSEWREERSRERRQPWEGRQCGGAPTPSASSVPPAPACWANPPWQGKSASDLPTPAKSTLTCPCALSWTLSSANAVQGRSLGPTSHYRAASYRPCP